MTEDFIYIGVYEGGTVAFSSSTPLVRYIETMDVSGGDVVLYDTNGNIYELAVTSGGFFKPDLIKIAGRRKTDKFELEYLLSELKAYLIFLGEDEIDADLLTLAGKLKSIQQNI